MAILLKDAIKPNLVQTLENTPVILHGGPFASIAQGTNSVIATKMGLSLSDYVVTEAGFGADLGAEKFLHIKCGSSGLRPKATVLVVTVRALRHHGGATKKEYNIPSLDRVKEGFANVGKHIENLKKFGMTPIVAINTLPDDSIAEVTFIKETCEAMGITAVTSDGFANGGKGCTELAHAVVEAIEEDTSNFKMLYERDLPVTEKISTLAREIYGARDVFYSAKAIQQLESLKKNNFDRYPVCMVKTPSSLSDDPKAIGRPRDFDITVREFEVAAGAGFVLPILGDTLRMPGLPSTPAAEHMDIDNNGVISGLS